MEEAANRSPRDIAAFGLDSTANTIYNFTKSGIDFTQIDTQPPEVSMALPALMEMYDRLPNGTWKGTQRFASSVIRDPVNFVGGVANFKLVRQLLAKGGTKAVREHLMERAAKAAGYTIIGAEGSAYAAMAEYMNQKLKHDPEQGEWQPDWPQIFAMGGFGVVAAAGGTAAIRAVPDAVRAGREIVTEKAAAVRDLFDAPAEAGTTLTSGVDPTPAITAALNYAGRKTRKSGQVVGAPPEITSQRALTKLRRNLEAAAREGEPGRFWYERSGRAILDALGGDRAEADKLAQAIAITSSATGVDTNFDFALQAFLQHKAGQPVRTGRFPANMSKRIQEVFDGKDWEGRKTNNFYVNLMRVIDPSKAQGVTTDMWMMRAFGFKNPDGTPYSGTPTDAQYTFVEQETKRIADQLGWQNRQPFAGNVRCTL